MTQTSIITSSPKIVRRHLGSNECEKTLQEIVSRQTRMEDMLYTIMEHLQRLEQPPVSYSSYTMQSHHHHTNTTLPAHSSSQLAVTASQQPAQSEQTTDLAEQEETCDFCDTMPLSDPAKADIKIFTPVMLAKIKMESCSRPNFAANLVRSLFTVAERKISNVRGKGKKQLDPAKIQKVEEAAFQQYPLETGEARKSAWANCIKAIDEAGRRLVRAQKTS